MISSAMYFKSMDLSYVISFLVPLLGLIHHLSLNSYFALSISVPKEPPQPVIAPNEATQTSVVVQLFKAEEKYGKIE